MGGLGPEMGGALIFALMVGSRLRFCHPNIWKDAIGAVDLFYLEE